MQVILLEKITHLGELGDIVKVKDGYARNYLIPTKRAKRATQAAIAEFEQRRAELEKAQAERIAAAEAIAAKLNGDVVEVASKAGVDGRLFGSVTNADIADALQAQGFDIKKAQIRLPNGPIKALGETPIVIGLMTDITAEITVRVVAEAVGDLRVNGQYQVYAFLFRFLLSPSSFAFFLRHSAFSFISNRSQRA